MLISVIVKPGSTQDVVLVNENLFHIYTKARPHNGFANKRIIELLADHFRIAKSLIKIKSGLTSKQKIIEIPDECTF